MSGLGMGEAEEVAGEGDGCDRCGCPDEEKCCPGFWSDRSIPPIFPLSWAFDPRNKWLNDNKYARIFGNIGFPFFDRERKAFLGVALAVTILSIVVTGFGCFALSSDPDTLRLTAWGVAQARYDHDFANATQDIGQIAYVGLRRFVIVACSSAHDNNWMSWSGCEDKTIWWENAECSSNQNSYYGFPCNAVDTCREAAVNNQFGAFMTCATLIFAMIGCLTRIRRVQDTNFQKMIGCLPDTFGCITQAQSLMAFAAGCYESMPEKGKEGQRFKYIVGAGYWGYVVCLIAAIVRVTIHYLTPVPGGGAGCQCCESVIGIDFDGDGQVAGRVAAREEARLRYVPPGSSSPRGSSPVSPSPPLSEPQLIESGLSKEEFDERLSARKSSKEHLDEARAAAGNEVSENMEYPANMGEVQMT